MKNNIVFYEDTFEYKTEGRKTTQTLIWKANKQYKILDETNDLIICEDETGEKSGIEKSIKNMYYTL